MPLKTEVFLYVLFTIICGVAILGLRFFKPSEDRDYSFTNRVRLLTDKKDEDEDQLSR